MDELHDRFEDWLVAGAEGEPPRDLAVHASGCDACLRSLAAIDSFQAIDIGAASLPPLRMASTGRESTVRTLRYAVGAVAVVLLGGSVAIGAFGLLRPAQLGSAQETPSPAEGVLSGVPSAPAASQPDSEQPVASASDSGKPKHSPSESPVAVATPAPQVLPHSTPTQPPPAPVPVPVPVPTTAPTRTPSPTSAPTATPIVTPPPTPTASPPPIDTDGDGVPDVTDECPTVPAGDFPDPLHPGCPLPTPSPSPSDPSPSP